MSFFTMYKIISLKSHLRNLVNSYQDLRVYARDLTNFREAREIKEIIKSKKAEIERIRSVISELNNEQ